MQPHRGLALVAIAALPLSLLALTGQASHAGNDVSVFNRVATYPVFQNVPAGVDPADETVAEISTVTEDGKTFIYTDAAGKRVGFVDITDPANPVGLGSLDLATPGNEDDQPTSVAVAGSHVLVVVDTSGGDFANPSGRLDVVRVSDRTVVQSIELGGQPDSIAISPDGAFAAIAMENQRDEDHVATDGGLPQAPAGFVQVVELAGSPDTWSADPVALPADALTGMDTPEDAEPEYGDINEDNQYVLTLQENNGVVVIDLPTRAIVNAFSAGNAVVPGIDDDNDGIFDFSVEIDLPREPDSVQWVGDNLVATANEGDWKGGTRGWTVFDATTGEVVWDAGNSFENLAVTHGLFNDGRADNKGAEPEGLAFEVMGGTPYAFVGSARSNFGAVYDMTDPTDPQVTQVLPTTNGPEGLLPLPSRDLLLVSSEEDDAGDGVRSTVGVYQYGAGEPQFPTIRSGFDNAGTPLGWGALGALSAAPGDAGHLYTASDAAYATGRIYKIDITDTPAVIDEVTEVRRTDGTKPAIDIEGLHARQGGGFWAAVEGKTGAGNKVLRVAGDGTILRTVHLPTEVTDHVATWGLEGVTATGTGATEKVYVVLQRPLWVDPSASPKVAKEGNVARIGRYDVATGTWAWFGYQLETTGATGDWIGLSEVTAVDDNTLAIIERDKLNGTTARIKRVYTVTVPADAGSSLQVLPKKLAADVLPALQAPKGWTQEKLEGLAIGADNMVYAVTDNDGVDDATGETVLMRLGSRNDVFLGSGTAPTPVPTPTATATATTATPSPTATTAPVSRKGTTVVLKVRRLKGTRYRLVAKVGPSGVAGTVVLKDGRRKIVVDLTNRRAVGTWRLSKGKHRLVAKYSGTATYLPSRDVLRMRVR